MSRDFDQVMITTPRVLLGPHGAMWTPIFEVHMVIQRLQNGYETVTDVTEVATCRPSVIFRGRKRVGGVGGEW